MKLNLKNIPIIAIITRRAELAAARFALREAGNLLRSAAPMVNHAGEKLHALSEHPSLQAEPSSFNL